MNLSSSVPFAPAARAPMWTNVGSDTANPRISPLAFSKAKLRHRFAYTLPQASATAVRTLDGVAYLAILEILKRLAPSDDPDEFVEPGALLQTCKILEILINERWPAPRIHWHGGDAVVLSWTRGARDILLTITEDGQSLLEMRGGIVERKAESLELPQLEELRPKVEQLSSYAYR